MALPALTANPLNDISCNAGRALCFNLFIPSPASG